MKCGCDLNLVSELVDVAEVQALIVEMVVRAALNSVIVEFM